jgi:alkanesulfonate monooxygenase SsuD/methylene tetrahydromethanopterin reductase-like flavin-dependent oxidoreductase (luciferase family)
MERAADLDRHASRRPVTHPLRFTASMPPSSRGIARWGEDLRSPEVRGSSGVAISDHLIGGWSMDPLAMLAAAAVSTTSLRLITLVLSNDYRHPALVHRATATIDVLSNGRSELGLGAGWW